MSFSSLESDSLVKPDNTIMNEKNVSITFIFLLILCLLRWCCMNLTATGRRKSTGGLAIAKRRFVVGVVVPLLLYESLGIFVLGWAFVLMFFDYSSGRVGGPILGLGGSNPFVGLGHFIEMFKGVSVEAKLFRTSLQNTLIFAIAILPLNLVITLPLAWLLESISTHFKAFYRTIYFMPVLTSSVGVALIWMSMYDPQAGWINAIIRSFGGKPVAWLADPRAGFANISVAMWAVILAYLWQDYGYNMVIFIAALQGIPQELKERFKETYKDIVKEKMPYGKEV